MKKQLALLLSILFLMLPLNLAPIHGQPPPDPDQGIQPDRQQIVCRDGTVIENGIEIVVRDMRGGLDYTATVLGIDNFDPILAIIDDTNPPNCIDNVRAIDNYALDLPTTNFVDNNRGNVQLRFNNGAQGEAVDVSVIVGEQRGRQGQFLLLLEGMFIAQFDESGDIFSIHLNPQISDAEIAPTVYAISVTGDLDPVLAFVDDEGEVLRDENNALISCDDAGFEESCWGTSFELQNFFVTRSFNRQLSTRSYDTMLTVPMGLADDEEARPQFYNYLVNSYQGSTFGDYVVAFHISTEPAE